MNIKELFEKSYNEVDKSKIKSAEITVADHLCFSLKKKHSKKDFEDFINKLPTKIGDTYKLSGYIWYNDKMWCDLEYDSRCDEFYWRLFIIHEIY